MRTATEEFREQLRIGALTNADEAGLYTFSPRYLSY